MITRTALGHLGRPLATDRGMVASYALVIAAVVLRLAAMAPSAFSVPATRSPPIGCPPAPNCPANHP